MKHGNKEKVISDSKSAGRMKSAWIWIAMALIILVAAGCVSKPIDTTKNETRATPETPTVPSTPTKPDLTLNNYMKLFEKDVIIVVGENATQIEIEGAQTIADNLKNITGNIPVIKTDAEITAKERAGNNLILAGRPEANSMFIEVYERTNATKVTNEFPGAGIGILEILRNPWNEDKVMLLVAGSDENGLRAAFNAYNKSFTSINGSIGYTEPEKGKLVQLIKLNQSAQALSEAEEKARSYFFETSRGGLLPNARYYTKGYEFDSYFIVEIREIYFGLEDTFIKFYRIERGEKI